VCREHNLTRFIVCYIAKVKGGNAFAKTNDWSFVIFKAIFSHGSMDSETSINHTLLHLYWHYNMFGAPLGILSIV